MVGKEIKGSKSWIPLGFINRLFSTGRSCVKIFVSTCIGQNILSQQEVDFQKQKSQLITAALVFSPAIFSILQGETGLALVYLSAFLIPMYREGLPPIYLVVGAAMGVLLVISLLFTAKTLIIAFSVIALVMILLLRRTIFKRNRELLLIDCWRLAFLQFVCWRWDPFCFQTCI